MDLLTHALFGAAIGEMFFGKRLGNRALVWGALFGVLPYLDAVVVPFLDSSARLWWDQGPVHSLFVVILAALVSAKSLAKFWKREKITPGRVGTFVFLTLSVHVLLDCTSVTDVAVFWPLPMERVGFGIRAGSDPLLALPLLVCIPWLAFLKRPKQRPKRLRVLGWGMGLCVAYLGFTVAMKFTATTGFDADLATRGVEPDRRVVIPTAYNSLVWRAVVDRGDALWVGHRSVFQKRSKPVRWVVYPRGISVGNDFATEREIMRIQSFTRGYWIARPHKRGLWIADLRAGEIGERGNRDQSVDFHMARAWNFESDAPKDRLIPAHARSPGIDVALRQIGRRIVGRDPKTDLIPRLAGVPGQFPESLSVVE